MTSADRSAASRARILDAAADAFRAHGYAATGIDAVMSAAGLTHGGFYAHFPSKAALLEATLVHLNESVRMPMVHAITNLTGERLVATAIDSYLSRHHRDHPEDGCPIPTLGAELPRLPCRHSDALATKVEGFAQLLARHLPGDAVAVGEQSRALVALLVGGIVTARTLPDDQVDAWLWSCRNMARRLAGLPSEPS